MGAKAGPVIENHAVIDDHAVPPHGPQPAGPVRRVAPAWYRLGRELCLVGIFGLAYELLRTDMVQDGAAASSHALSIVHLEQAMGLFHEGALQAAFLHVPDVVRAFNLYYGGTHFLVPAGALLWLAVRHPERYARARNALMVTTGVAFVCFWLFSVAPPRMLPSRFGIIDTLVTLGKSGHFESRLIDAAGDVYAAMPSLHVGWAVWCTVALYPVVRHRALRVLLVAYPVMTTIVVVTTGNHFFLDAAAGAFLAGASWLVVTGLSTRLIDRRDHRWSDRWTPSEMWVERSRRRRRRRWVSNAGLAHVRLTEPPTRPGAVTLSGYT